MNPIYGLLIFVIITIISALIRSLYLIKFVYNKKIAIYKLANSYGCYIGPMIYIISVFFIALGPLSFKIFNLDEFQYIIFNIIAGIGYGLIYPIWAPVTNSGEIIVVKRGNKAFAYVGKYMGRKFEVISMPSKEIATMVAKRFTGRCEFEVTVDDFQTRY